MPPAPPLATKLRGFMIDAARLPELPSHYRRLIDFCRDWGFNAILFRLTDDQGSALRWKSHPEFVTHRHALDAEELRDLAAYAASRGIDLIPEVESFGHARYITDVHPELSDKDPAGQQVFGGLIPVHPKTLRIIADLYRETASIFPSRYLHGGCDEVNWGGSELSRKALAEKSRTLIWAELLNALGDIARGLGKELIVWADHVLHHDPGIAELLNKDIILHDWQYAVFDHTAIERDARRALDLGLRVIGGPAMMWCRWGPRPGTSQLDNLDAFSEAYRGLDDPRSLGVLVTWWVPTRFFPNSTWDAIAYSGIGLSEGAAAARAGAFKRFVEAHYGAKWDETWADVFETVYERAPVQPGCAHPWSRPVLPVPWGSDAQLAEMLRDGQPPPPALGRLQAQLAECETRVRANLPDFRAFRLCIDALAYLYHRDTRLLAELTGLRQDPAAAARFIASVAREDRTLLDSMIENWNQVRPEYEGPPDDLRDLGRGDTPLHQLARAADYSRELAKDPERFRRLLAGPASL